MKTKNDFKKLGDECFSKLKELNPNGGIREFIRMAVEFGYKERENEIKDELERLRNNEPHLSQGNNDFPENNTYVEPWESMGK